MAKTPRDPEAPHGRDENGVALAPYGWKADGKPRVSNAGRKSGGAPASATARSSAQSRTAAAEQRKVLLGGADMILTSLAGVANNPAVAKRVGDKRACALAGTSVILEGFMPAAADIYMEMAQTRPGLLTWMDTMEEKAPFFKLAMLGVQITKAVAANFVAPDPRLAQAARLRLAMRAAQMADAIEEEARKMGISLDQEEQGAGQEQREHERAAA